MMLTHQVHLHKLAKHEQMVPRYTSYPTTPHFSSLETSLYRDWLTSLTLQQPISLYCHIPFCQKLCWYCGCHTKVTHNILLIQSYVDALHQEMGLIQDTVKGSLPCARLHFGGGSPSYLEPQLFVKLMQSVRKHFTLSESCDIAIEIDPRHLNEAKIKTYKQMKVNRISLGIQDFDTNVQSIIHRVQPLALVQSAVALLRSYDFKNINLDLIYGLPGQTIASIQQTLQHALELDPSRIALFGYAHVPWKKKHMHMIAHHPLPDSALRVEMFSVAAEFLQNSGYVAIGLDHFAKKDDALAKALVDEKLQRNFQGYEANNNILTLLGIGVSSISQLPQGYAQNSLDLKSYQAALNQQTFPVAKGFVLHEQDRLYREIIQNLMCYLKVDLKIISKKYQLDDQYFSEILKKLQVLQEDSLIFIQGLTLSVYPETRQAVRLVCAIFDQYFKPMPKKHASMS